MSGSDWPLQQAIYTALTGNATLMTAVSDGVFDNVVQDYSIFPYVTIGENIQTPFDMDDKVGDFNAFDIHVWSRKSGKKEVKVINGHIYDILNRNSLTVTGYGTVDCLAEGSTVVLDPDGKTYHGINSFRITLVES